MVYTDVGDKGEEKHEKAIAGATDWALFGHEEESGLVLHTLL